MNFPHDFVKDSDKVTRRLSVFPPVPGPLIAPSAPLIRNAVASCRHALCRAGGSGRRGRRFPASSVCFCSGPGAMRRLP